MLAICIVIYDATHKVFTASPWLMGLCRFWVYVIAGTTGAEGLNGWPIWCGVALAFYIVGLSCVARRESFRGPIPCWPLLLLAAPVVLAHADERRRRSQSGVVCGAHFCAVGRALRADAFFSRAKSMSDRIVSGLLAGIVFVDWLAVAPQCPETLSFVLLILFGLTHWFQRFIPAT